MNRVVHFEIYAADPARMAEFYRQVFGWQIEPWGPPEGGYWHITTGEDEPGINGGLWRRQGSLPLDGAAVNAYTCTIEVENIDETIATTISAGGSVAIDKSQIPEVGWLAYCKDPEGNWFGIVQR